MKKFRLLFDGIDTAPALDQLRAHPELWAAVPQRLTVPDSPHVESQDIWLRFRNKGELQEPADYGAPHFAEFWPAWHLLPGLHPVVFDAMRAVEAVYLGGCLITKIPPGASIHPHIDHGWHPTFNNCKVYIILQANPECVNYCEDEHVKMRAGEAWMFRNDIVHSVENNGATDRIAVICTMRVERELWPT